MPVNWNISNRQIYTAIEIDIEMWHFYSSTPTISLLNFRQNIFSYVRVCAYETVFRSPKGKGDQKGEKNIRIKKRASGWNVQMSRMLKEVPDAINRWLNEWLVFIYELICWLVIFYFYHPIPMHTYQHYKFIVLLKSVLTIDVSTKIWMLVIFSLYLACICYLAVPERWTAASFNVSQSAHTHTHILNYIW